jgi:predicted ATPase/signal transduction histidine kinase/DNA-binding response OmpR family regulator
LINIPGIEIVEPIYRSRQSLVAIGKRHSDDQLLVIKYLNYDFPEVKLYYQFKNEFMITKKFESPRIIKVFDLEKCRNSLAIVMEYIGKQTLEQVVESLPPSWPKALDIAIQLTAAVGEIHERKIIHKDINPTNIIYEPQSDQLKIIDFGLATELGQEEITAQVATAVEGTLEYISPEQTGRLNRRLDYRTDLYSLGATLYFLFSGQPPFVRNDPSELIHCHLALKPIPLHELDDQIPPILGKIINRLLAKTPEDRYQSIDGILIDLKACREGTLNGYIPEFTLGKQDIARHLNIPEKLYGRQPQIERLMARYQAVASGGKDLVLVGGTSGSGKTSVIKEIKNKMVDTRGFFAEGKFDQFQRDIPYRGILLALNRVINQILSLPKEDTDKWREIFLEGLQHNGKLITDVMPQLELVVGPQDELADVGPIEEQNRFHYALETFFTVITWDKRPLVLFLDDLQWADLPTLRLIEVVMANPDQNHLMVIGSYRNNEVEPSHPLMQSLSKIEAYQNCVTRFTLEPLNHDDLTELVEDTLFMSHQDCQDLSAIIMNKTHGNPFFSVQLLQAFYKQGYIWFDSLAQSWKFSADKMQQSDITENVVDLMIDRIDSLPRETITILGAAACVGDQFNLDLLATISGKSPEHLNELLVGALKDGILVSLDQQYKFLGAVPPKAIWYRFLHDRVQQAAYSFCDAQARAKYHYTIGHWFWRQYRETNDQNLLFQITSHMDLASGLVAARHEQNQLAEMFLLAAKQARKSAAYNAAIDSLNKCLSYAGINYWEEQYKLSLEAHQEKVEVFYTLGQYEQMSDCIDQIIEHSSSIQDQLPIYYTEPLAYIAQSQPEEAIKSGLKGLALLGLTFPRHKTIPHILWALINTRRLWRKNRIIQLLDGKPLNDPTELAKMKIMSTIKSACYFADSEQLLFNTCQQVRISIQKGHTGISAIAYCTYGLVLCGILYDIEAGSEFGRLSLGLVDKLNAQDCVVEVGYIYHNFIAHYRHHLSYSFDELQKVYQHGIETGNLEFAANSLMTRSYFAFFTGMELQQVDRMMSEYTQIITYRLKQGSTADFFSIMWQTVANLRGESSNPTELTGDHMDEAIDLQTFDKKGLKTALLIAHMMKAHLNYLFGNIDGACREIKIARKYQDFMLSHPNFIFMKFNLCMIELARYENVSFWQKRKIIFTVCSNLYLFKKWSIACPENYLHHYLLIRGELNRVKGNFDLSLELLQQAAHQAQKNGYLQFEALANELLAKMWRQRGNEKVAEVFLREAVHYYNLWGARAKVDEIKAHFPNIAAMMDDHLPREKNIAESIQGSLSPERTISFSDNLDIESVVKAIQAISSQMDLDSLLKEIMKITMEAAGVDHGLLVIQENEELFLKIIGSTESGISSVNTHLEAESQIAPLSVLQLCLRTQKILNYDDAQSSEYNYDPYIIKYQTKSFLCIPVVDQNMTVSVLYLENRLTPAIFDRSRVKLLSILASQAAVSIKNAELVANMNQVNEMKTKLVDDLKSNDQYRMQFFNNISHELRTPLNGLIGFLDLFQKGHYGELTDRSQLQVEKMRYLADSLKIQVNTILDLARSRTGSLKLVHSRFPLDEVFEESKILAESLQNSDRDTEIISQFSSQLTSTIVISDREKVVTIIRNLLGNAFKFSRDRENPLVKFRMEIDANENIVIIVEDNGIGIAKEAQKTIFEQFKRVDHYGQKDYEGSGLGLAMVDHLVKLMSGSIEVVSDSGQGATFIVRLPQADSPDLIEQDTVNSQSLQTYRFNKPVTESGYQWDETQPLKSRILVVDDNELNCEIIRDILTRQGYRVLTLANGHQAMASIEKFAPDLIILDLMMPQGSGEEILRSIKAHRRYASIPVILLTARASHEDRLHGLELGADDYMAKPILSDELVVRVANTLSRIDLTRESERRLTLESTVADAQKIHESLGLEALQIPGIEFTHYYQMAELTGGDWLGMDYHPQTNRLYIMIADATGHGFQPAVLTVAVAGAVNGALSIISKKAAEMSMQESIELLHLALNESVMDTGNRIERQVTMAFCCLDLQTGQLMILNAGHRELLHCSKEGVKGVLARGSMLGFAAEEKSEIRTVQLVPGDSLFLYTDGLVENMGPKGDCVKMKKLRQLLEHGASADSLKTSVLGYCQSIWQNQPATDDCTFLIVRWLGDETTGTRLASSSEGSRKAKYSA